jgi:hypothetical protein
MMGDDGEGTGQSVASPGPTQTANSAGGKL